MPSHDDQRRGYRGDTPSGQDETMTPEPDAVVDERRRVEEANILGMQGAGTSATGEASPRKKAPPRQAAPTVSGLSEFDAAGRPIAPGRATGAEDRDGPNGDR